MHMQLYFILKISYSYTARHCRPVAMYGLLAESHIRNYNIKTYQVLLGREGSYNTISPVTSVFNIITKQDGNLLS